MNNKVNYTLVGFFDLLGMFFGPIDDQLQELLEAIESTNYSIIEYTVNLIITFSRLFS